MDNSKDHIRRINNVILYIENNLSDHLSIDQLADLACFSKFHFNRIFKSVTGESVYHYIKRVRLERASYYLWSSENPIKEIAAKCGFNTTSNFSYNYKKHFGISAREQRELNSIHKQKEPVPDIPVEIKELPARTLTYIKNIGSYNEPFIQQVKELYKWGNARGLCHKSFDVIYMGYDSPYVTKEEHLRADICIEVPGDTKPAGDISIMKFPRIKVVSSRVESMDDISEIRDDLDTWILSSGFETIIGVPSLMIFHNISSDDLGEVHEQSFNIELCVPVKPK